MNVFFRDLIESKRDCNNNDNINYMNKKKNKKYPMAENFLTIPSSVRVDPMVTRDDCHTLGTILYFYVILIFLLHNISLSTSNII